MLHVLRLQYEGVFEGFFLCLCAANGAELEGQSTNALPGGHEGERAAVPQPH